MKRDFKPLTEKISLADISNYNLKYKTTKSAYIAGVITLIILFCLMISVLEPIKWLYEWNPDGLTAWSVGMCLLFTVAIVLGLYFRKQEAIKSIRLKRFVAKNNLEYTDLDIDPARDGIMFKIGNDHVSYDILSSGVDSLYKIANHRYVVGSDKENRTYRHGYVMIQLDRKLPHIILDSKKNNANLFGLSLTNLPVAINGGQKLSLEGDFDSHFNLYVTEKYETDALYIFTPDLMALFIDESGDFDAEIIGDKLYIYSDKPYDVNNQKILRRFFEIIDIIMPKIQRQTKNYTDEKIVTHNNSLVLKKGWHFNKKLSPLTIVIILLIILKLLEYLAE